MNGSMRLEAQDFSGSVSIVKLEEEPNLKKILSNLAGMVRREKSRHLILDFSKVDIVSAKSVSMLLEIKKSLDGNDLQLVFCNVSTWTAGQFAVLGLDGFFKLAKDLHLATEILAA